MTLKCFFAHQSPAVRLGTPAISVKAIRPMIPYFGISSMLRGSPTAEEINVSFRFTVVFPWLFMRFPRLRLPKAE